jgi:hypothetical protein
MYEDMNGDILLSTLLICWHSWPCESVSGVWEKEIFLVRWNLGVSFLHFPTSRQVEQAVDASRLVSLALW